MELSILQTLVRRWCVRAFGQAVADDHRERNHRFLEEALELAQSLGCTAEDAHVLVEYVFGRPAGKAGQEVGGVLITLAALCGAHRDLSMDREAKAELGRINRSDVLEKIRAKQAAKARDIPMSPLPGTTCPIHGETLPCKLCELGVVGDRRTMQEQPRQHTDAVGTDGCRATVSKPI